MTAAMQPTGALDARGGGGPAAQQQQQQGGEGPSEEAWVGDWFVLRSLASSTFAGGRVVLGQHRTSGEQAAIKLLPRGQFVSRYGRYVEREILHQASLQHPFIVNLRQLILTPKSLALAMEFAPGGTLLDHTRARGRLSEGEARWMFQQLIVGLAYCHDRGVANRDLKLDNILLVPRPGAAPPAAAGGAGLAGAAAGGDGGIGEFPLLKICDFGFSKHEHNSTAKTRVGTPVYMAPEVIAGSAKYNAKRADIWSCGVILYTLLFGTYPFDPNSKDYALAIVKGQWSLPPDSGVSEEAKDLVRQLMAFDPVMRIDIPAILAHPWFLRALPPGAATMNAAYLAAAPSLDAVGPTVRQLVQAAGAEGRPGEAPQLVSFEAPRPG